MLLDMIALKWLSPRLRGASYDGAQDCVEGALVLVVSYLHDTTCTCCRGSLCSPGTPNLPAPSSKGFKLALCKVCRRNII